MKQFAKFGAMAAGISLIAISALAATVESGLKPGATPGAFQVVDVTGPNKGRQLCYRCQYGASPVVAAFVNGDATKSEKLLTDLQKIVDSHKTKGLRSFVVFMSGPEAKDSIQKVAADKKISIPLVFLPRGSKEEDIAAYNINPAAKNTVILWNRSSVKENFVNVDPTKITPIEKAVDAMLH